MYYEFLRVNVSRDIYVCRIYALCKVLFLRKKTKKKTYQKIWKTLEFLGKISNDNKNNQTFENDQYRKLLRENVTKTYNKSNFNEVRNFDNKAKKITENFPVADRSDELKEKETYIRIKDQNNKTTCRLINTCNSSIGIISIIIIIIVINKALFVFGQKHNILHS